MSSKRDCPVEEPSRVLKKAKTDPSERTELSSEIDEAERLRLPKKRNLVKQGVAETHIDISI